MWTSPTGCGTMTYTRPEAPSSRPQRQSRGLTDASPPTRGARREQENRPAEPGTATDPEPRELQTQFCLRAADVQGGLLRKELLLHPFSSSGFRSQLPR